MAVIDPGPPLASHVDDVLAALGPGETVTHVLITHTHSDHSSLTARLQALTGARSYGFGPHGAVRAYDPDDRVDFSAYFTAEEKTRFDKEWDDLPAELKREGPDLDFRPDERLGDGDAVRGDGWTLTAVHTPGHCSNHLCYYLQEENCLFSGDHVMGWATSVVSPPDGSMQDYLASLRKLLPRQAERYWPTHGPAITEPDRYVRACIAHREDREQQIIAHLRGGVAAHRRHGAQPVRRLRQAPVVSGGQFGARPPAAPRRHRPRQGGRWRRAEAYVYLRVGIGKAPPAEIAAALKMW